MNRFVLSIGTILISLIESSCSNSTEIGKYASSDGENIIIFSHGGAYLGRSNAPGRDDIDIIKLYGTPVIVKNEYCQVVAGLTFSYSNSQFHSCNSMNFNRSNSKDGVLFRAKCKNQKDRNCPFPTSDEQKYWYEYLVHPGFGIKYIKIYDNGPEADQIYYFKSGKALLNNT